MFQSPTYGEVDLEKLKNIVSAYMAADKKAKYEIIVGTDSQKMEKGGYDFVSALVIHRIGFGGIYFWKRVIDNKKMVNGGVVFGPRNKFIQLCQITVDILIKKMSWKIRLTINYLF